jgi:hypothetical protein
LLRSRQHRVMLSFYLGIGLGLALFVAHMPEVYQHAQGLGAWYRVNAPVLVGSLFVLCSAVLGTRIAFALPLEVRANWVFRIMPRAGGSNCLSASRRSLYALSVLPVLLLSTAFFLWLWPWKMAAQHLLILGLLGTIGAEVCLHGFQKIPFTCSYLPGKTKFNMALMYVVLFLIAAHAAADFEMEALGDGRLYLIVVLVLTAAAALVRWRTSKEANWEGAKLQFEEEPTPAVLTLEIHKDGAVPLL